MRNHFSFEIPFMRYRKILLTISAVLSVLALVGLLVRGLTFGIEFQGGTEIDFNNTGDISIEQMRKALTDAGENDPTIQTTTASDGENGFVGLGNDEDGYWKVERAFCLAPSAHEGEEPAWREVPIPAFRAALRRRAASAAC